ncbi:hypothetical protein BIW11_09513 [Tropilaelaps mercedesae]|uniref:SWIM-type domain-containing protein n=1 Tax=Tropilaelaps mercedesae TaxID=418985 RepID=A0A1V9XJY4_9ACAR|nr:hypothetical protein BIW11_09513 [Tropilaelaps mercedesae]
MTTILFYSGQFSTFERGLKLREHNRMVTFTRIDDREIKVSTSKDSCTCVAFRALRLPCLHLLSFRIGSQLDLYSEALVDERWKRNNIRVEGDADKLVRLPLTGVDTETIETHSSLHMKDLEGLEVQVIQEYVEHPASTQAEEIAIEMPSDAGASTCVVTEEQVLSANDRIEEFVEEVRGDDQSLAVNDPVNQDKPSSTTSKSRDQVASSSQSPTSQSKRPSPSDLESPMKDKRQRYSEAGETAQTRAPRQYRERRKQIEELCTELCAVGSGVWGPLFSLRMGILREILEAWQDGQEVRVQRIHHELNLEGRAHQHQQVPHTSTHSCSARDGSSTQLATVLDTTASVSSTPYALEQQTAAATRSVTPTVLRYNPVLQMKGSQQLYFLNSEDNSVQLVDNYPGQVYTIETTDVAGDDVLMQ